MNTLKKQAIYQSLEGMNSSETERLILYIKSMLYNPKNDLHWMRKKAAGIQEIQKALSEQEYA